MGKFLTPLKVEKITEREWMLTDALVYDSATVGVIVVRAGFKTNFGSVPRLPFIYLLFGGVGDEECTLHDHLYSAPHEIISGSGLSVDRRTADRIMRGAIYERLRVDDASLPGILRNAVSLGLAWAMWAGVRVGGGPHWG